MAQNIDTLQIDVKVVNKATKSLNKIADNLKSLSSAIEKIDTKKFNNLANTISNLGNATGHTVNTMKALGTNLMSVNSKVNTLKGNVDKLVGSFNKLNKAKTSTKNIADTKGTQETLSNKANVDDTNNSFFKGIQNQLNGSETLSKVATKISSIGKTIGTVISSAFDGTKKAAGVIGTVLGDLGKAQFKTMGTLASGLAKKVLSVNKSFSKLASTFSRVLTYKAISMLFQAINKAISQGISNLYQYSKLMGGTFSKSMDQLATSCQYFSNSVASAIAPLINVIAPVVDAIIDKLVEAINVINQFFSALTGAKTWTKAKKQATQYASAVSSASDKLKGSLAGFDEINNIGNTNNSSGSGSSADYGSMFEEQNNILTDISEFATKLRDAFNQGDWNTLGSLLGNKLNEMVDSIDWAGIGNKLGYGLNGAIATVSSFIDNVDWYNISAKISTMFNSTIAQIDFSNLGSICMSKFTIIGDLILGAIETIDWYQVGVSIKDFFIGAFDKGSQWIDGYDWNKIGSDLWIKFKQLIQGLDFTSIARSFFTLFGKALGAAVSLVAGFFKGIVEDMLGYFKQYTTNEDGTKKTGIDFILGILEGIIDGLKNIGQWILDNVFTPIIDGFKSAFKINSPSKVMEEIGGYIVDGFMEGFNLFSQVGDKVAEWSGKVVEWFTKGEDGKGIVEHFQEIGGNIITKFKEKISTKYTDTKNSITTWASNVKSWFTNDGKVNSSEWQTYANNVITGFKTKITNSYTNTKSSISTWASNVNTWFKDKASKSSFYEIARDVVNGFGNGIGDLYYSTKSKIQSWASSVSSWFKSKLSIHSPSRIFYGFGENVIQGFNNSIKDLGYTSEKAMSNWTKEIISQSPSVALGMDTSSLNYDTSSLAHNLGISADGSVVLDETNSETNMLLEQLISQVANIDLNPYITVKDVGKASVKYINQQARIMGTNLV